MAAKAKVPVVPITMIGTGRLMPNKQESRMFPGNVRMVVHPIIEPQSADKMLEQARNSIQGSLPPEMQPKSLKSYS